MYRYIIGVGGMACGSCESHVNNEARKHFPNVSVKSSHLKKQTIIESKEKTRFKRSGASHHQHSLRLPLYQRRNIREEILLPKTV